MVNNAQNIILILKSNYGMLIYPVFFIERAWCFLFYTLIRLSLLQITQLKQELLILKNHKCLKKLTFIGRGLSEGGLVFC